MARLGKAILGSVLGVLLLTGSVHAQTSVDLELALLVDVSGSVDHAEYNLQKTGYVNAFSDPALWAAIDAGALGRIAVTYIEWSGSGQQSQLVGWTLIDSQAAANAFAAAINSTSRLYDDNTAVGEALVFGGNTFAANPFVGTRKVIDISGDGCNNEGITAAQGRAAAVAAGVDAINGLVIDPLGETCSVGGVTMNVGEYYNSEVMYNGFVEVATNFDDFEATLNRKLIREITSTPEPVSMVLLGTGLAGLGVVRRRRRVLAE